MMTHLVSTTALGLAILVGTAAGQTTWIVDKNGGGDFTEIAHAIASPLVVDGDVLRVEPGWYASFVLRKALSIVGAADAQPWEATTVVVDGPASFALAGFDFQRLTVRNVPGRARLEDGNVGWLYLDDDGAGLQLFHIGQARFEGCAELVASRVDFAGSDYCRDTFSLHFAEAALTIHASNVTLVECDLVGGNGTGAEGLCSTHYPTAGQALMAFQSLVLLAGCRLDGGYGNWVALDTAALHLVDSTAWVAGLPRDAVVSHEGLAVDGSNSIATLGTRFQPAALPAWVSVAAVPPPWLRASGAVVPGGAFDLELFGPAGALAVCWVSATPAFVDLAPALALPLWTDAAGLLFVAPVALQGAQSAAALTVDSPADPTLTGVALTAQALVVPGAADLFELTNPVDLVLRW
jgi:hypothetical protein